MRWPLTGTEKIMRLTLTHQTALLDYSFPDGTDVVHVAGSPVRRFRPTEATVAIRDGIVQEMELRGPLQIGAVITWDADEAAHRWYSQAAVYADDAPDLVRELRQQALNDTRLPTRT